MSRSSAAVRNGELAGVALIVVVAAILRLRGLARYGLWFDELVTWQYVIRTSRPFVAGLRDHDAAMVAYLGGLWVWRHGGTSEMWLRLPSVLGGTLAVAATIALARRVAGRRAALVAGVLVTVSPQMVRYSQEVRAYAIEGFLAVLATALLVAAVDEQPRRLARPGYVVAAALLVGSHQLAVVILVAHVVALAIARVPWRRWLLMMAGALVAAVPSLLLLRGQGGNTAWIEPVSRRSAAAALRIIAPLPVVALVVLVAIWWAVARVGGRERNLGTVVVVCCAVLPWPLVAVISFAHPALLGRYLLVTIPFACVSVAGAMFARDAPSADLSAGHAPDGARRWSGRLSRALPLVAAFSAVCLLGAAWQWQRSGPLHDERYWLDQSATLRTVDRRFGPCDRLAYSSVLARNLASYYLPARGPAIERVGELPPMREGGVDGPACTDASLWVIGVGPETDVTLAAARAQDFVDREVVTEGPHLRVVRLSLGP